MFLITLCTFFFFYSRARHVDSVALTWAAKDGAGTVLKGQHGDAPLRHEMSVGGEDPAPPCQCLKK